LDFWSVATLVVESIILIGVVGVAGLFVFIFALMIFGAVSSPDLGKPRPHEYDLWDEPDGMMYVQLPTGEVRLD
jgi:hypothetical protein